MRTARRRGAFTLIEVAIVVGIIAALVITSAYLMRDWFANQHTKGVARSLADVMLLAREEAIRTGVNHLVFFSLDASDTGLTASGRPVAALAVRDDNGDGAPQSDEVVGVTPFDTSGSTSWGAAFALTTGSEVPAPNDNPAASYPLANGFACCSFTQPGGTPARWIAFLPDGTPRSFSIGPFSVGEVTTGSGTVYISNGSRDFGVVIAPLGGVRVHSFRRGPDAWIQ